MQRPIFGTLAIGLTPILVMVVHRPPVSAADRPQWGEAWSRNQASAERDLPATFEGAIGKNVRWSAALGSESHSTPVVAGGRVYVGTNNGEPRDPKRVGDRGVLLCLDERDGTLRWQLVVPKRYEDPFFDWPGAGLCSSATVENGRVYVVDNRGMVLCLDAEGLANGNDGPFVDEAAYYTPAGGSGLPRPPVEGADVRPEPGFQKPETQPDALGPLDADIVWMFDLVGAAGCWPHDSAHSSILIHGNHLYLNTSTGVDNTHRRNRAPDAPALVVLDKRTGRYLARETEGIARATFHCNWSAPAITSVGGEEVILFIGGDGRLYGFAPLVATEKVERAGPSDGIPFSLKRVFRYEFDREAPTDDLHSYVQNRREGPSNHYGMPVAVGESVYLAGGGDIFWGKNGAWVKRVDLVRRGADIVPIERWAAPLNQHTLCTPAVANGLVFAADTARTVHCLDAETGRSLWSHDGRGAFWASAFVADGKVFIGSRSGDFWVFRAAREKEVLFETKLPDKLSATAVAANGVLYLTTMNRLYAIAETKNQ